MRVSQILREAKSLLAKSHIDFLPLRHTLRAYDKSKFQADWRAGFDVALLAFPQSMAYAFIAGLPIHYGIYGSIVASLVGAVFAGSHYITLGPTNATAVMLLSAFTLLGLSDSEKQAALPLLLMLVGTLLVIGAFLRVANLIQYISRTVVTGYITAAAALIIANQIKSLLGFQFEEKATTFLQVVAQTLYGLPQTHWETACLSIMTLGSYLAVKKYWPGLPSVAVTLAFMSLLAAALQQFTGLQYETLTAVNPSSWQLTIPIPSIEMIGKLANSALAIALLCVLEGTSIGKSLAARAGDRLDANQEMFSIGMANIGCAVLSGMPASGSLTRSALSWTSGALSPMASLLNGAVCAAFVLVLGPLIAYIPQASLAVIVVAIGVSLINRHAIRVVLKATRSDAIVFMVTFLAGLVLPLDTAIYYGVATSILLFLRKASAPEMVEYTFTEDGELAEVDDRRVRVSDEISIVHVEGNLFFGAADLFRDQIRRVFEDPKLKVVVLKMRNAHLLDATSVMALEELVNFMREKGRYLLVSEAREDVLRIFRKSGIADVIGRENIFPDIATNHTLSTAHALRRAKEVIQKSVSQ